jgi:hypothetical protein
MFKRQDTIGLIDHADILGVIGDAGKIERSIDPDVVAERRLDRLTLEILVSIARTGLAVAEGPGVTPSLLEPRKNAPRQVCLVRAP